MKYDLFDKTKNGKLNSRHLFFIFFTTDNKFAFISSTHNVSLSPPKCKIFPTQKYLFH